MFDPTDLHEEGLRNHNARLWPTLQSHLGTPWSNVGCTDLLSTTVQTLLQQYVLIDQVTQWHNQKKSNSKEPFILHECDPVQPAHDDKLTSPRYTAASRKMKEIKPQITPQATPLQGHGQISANSQHHWSLHVLR